MNKKQQLFSEFFQTMIKMRRIIEQTLDSSDNNPVSTLLQIQALETIQSHTKISAGKLASSLEISSSSLSQLTDRMIDAKLISRVHSKTDRRSVYLILTKPGQKHLTETMKTIRDKTSKILSPMSEDDLKTVINIFTNVLEKQNEN